MTKSPHRATPEPSPSVRGNDHPPPRRKDRRWLTVVLLIIIILVAGLIGVFSLMNENETNAPEGRRADGVVYASARMGGAMLSPIKAVLW